MKNFTQQIHTYKLIQRMFLCRIRNASTPDVARNLSDTTLSALHNISRVTSRSRVTLMSSDIAQLQSESFMDNFFFTEFH